jgi:DNA-directed RNA polymerase subunit omega
MARVTIEDCLGHVENMYELVHVATQRSRQLFNGAPRTVRSKNKEVVSALREIAEGHIHVAMETEANTSLT